MLDVKSLLETTELKVEETCFVKPPPLPYIIFSEEREESGADNKNNILERNITIELYSQKINREKEKLIEDLLKGKSIKFKKERLYIDTENFFQTMYDFYLYEKEV